MLYLQEKFIEKINVFFHLVTVKTAFHSIYLTLEIEIILEYSYFICFV